MARYKKVIKKSLKITGLVILALVLIVILAISSITHYLIEKYDVEYTGREITMDDCYVNPLTGVVCFENLKIYEDKSDSLFFTSSTVEANFALFQIFTGTFEISSLSIDKPMIRIMEHEKGFNFSDLIETFSSTDTIDISEEKAEYNILDISISNGLIIYDEAQTPVKYAAKEFNVTSKGLRWDNDTLPLIFSFSSNDKSGSVKGITNINIANLNYEFDILFDNFDLDIVNQYLKDLTNFGKFSAILNANVYSTGNFLNSDSISASGRLNLTEFHFGKNGGEDFASFEELDILVNELTPFKLIYDFDSITLAKPFFKYELYDELDNIQTMFGEGGSNVTEANTSSQFNLVIEIAHLVEQLAKNVLRSDYKIKRLAIYDGDFQYVDYTLGERFSTALTPFNLSADSINKQNKRVSVAITSGIVPYGSLEVNISVDPNDSADFDMDYKFKNIALSMFNPYLIYYTSFPLDRGTLEIVGDWKVRDAKIKSTNHLLVIDPRVSKKIRNKDTKWIPVPLAMIFVRERGNVIDYEIPILGNLKDPKFVIKDVLLDLVKNIFIKPVTTPYGFEVKNIELKLEKSLSLHWPINSSEIANNQRKFILQIINFLKENPDAHISISPNNYETKEKELFLLFEAKKKYYLTQEKKKSGSLSTKDSIKITRMSIKDEAFMAYLDKKVSNSTLFSVQQKSAELINSSTINSKFNQLNNERKANFIELFIKEGVENQVKFKKSKSVIPYDGSSFYAISYNGDYPMYLYDAFSKMEELNKNDLRKKYIQKRSQN